MLPESYALTGAHLITGSHPVASGPVADVYQGSLDGSKICVKRTRIYSAPSNEGFSGVQKVRRPLPAYCLPL